METVIAGIIATAAMTAFVASFKQLRIAPVNGLRAIGAGMMGSRDYGLSAGLALHFTFGIIFAFVYRGAIAFVGSEAGSFAYFLGPAIGFFHGIVSMMLLVILVAEHHPLHRYRESGLGVPGIYLAAHVLYGTVLGLVLALLRG